MPFRIVRNDITKMNTEAIVNTANDHPTVGTGCDSAVYRAAGYDELLAYRTENIGIVPEGEVFITPGFNLQAKYIIHAVSPLYMGGNEGEEEKVRSCYRKSLMLAKDKGIRSIAFPLISTGGFGYPGEEGIRIAADEINGFLLDNEMDIFLVVFDDRASCLGKRLYPGLEEYIDQNYVEEKHREEYEEVFCGTGSVYNDSDGPVFQNRLAARRRQRAEEAMRQRAEEALHGVAADRDVGNVSRSVSTGPGLGATLAALTGSIFKSRSPQPERKAFKADAGMMSVMNSDRGQALEADDDLSSPVVFEAEQESDLSSPVVFETEQESDLSSPVDFETEHESRLNERISHISDTFSQYLMYLIKDRKMENTDVYKRALVNKKIFSKIKNNPDYHPQKITALCLCVGAKLNLDESKDLLSRAGYALSPCDKMDIIFSYFIENGIYDMLELDIQLEEHGLPCIIS